MLIRKVYSLYPLTRLLNMVQPHSSNLQSLEENAKIAEDLCASVEKLAVECVDMISKLRLLKVSEENQKLRQEVEYYKKELMKYESLNGVKQMPLPGEEAGPIIDSDSVPGIRSSEMKEYSFSSSVAEDSSESKRGESLETSGSNETKSAKASKPKKPAAPAAPEAPVDVSRLDIRVGKILHAQVHPDADGLYIEQIDVGEQISRTVVSGLVKHIPLSELDQRMVVVLCNLKPQKMRGIVSEAMVLCASTPQTVELLMPPAHAKAGDNITVPGYPRNPDLPFMNPKKKIFEKVADDLKVNSNKQACYKDVPWEVEGKGGFITVHAMSGCHIK